ncbi:uncharacterized protein LOC142627283 [Castanea sativa]|uniref:uncharacterized protein LOC142627283 n=1 Tax=Castanea sativa TaxID=21020 RepID=UPI003F64A120
MTNHIPLSLLSKMSIYDVEIGGANVKVSVVDNPAMVDAKINELRSSLQTSERQVVGLDVKFVKTYGILQNKGKILLLCAGSQCLMIQLPDSVCKSDTLGQFLSDETICFLGTGMSKIDSELDSLYYYPPLSSDIRRISFSVVELGFLAAKILKKPNVENHGLAELAGEVGMDIKEPISECPDWNAKVFTNEEIKYAVHNAYTSNVIGNKLCDML